MSTITHSAAPSWAAAHRILLIVLVAVVAATLVAVTMLVLGQRQDPVIDLTPVVEVPGPGPGNDPCANARPAPPKAC